MDIGHLLFMIWIYFITFIIIAIIVEHHIVRRLLSKGHMKGQGIVRRWLNRMQRRKIFRNTAKVRWLLPDDRVAESEVENVGDFIQLLRQVNEVACHSLSYKVAHVELIVEDDWWICVSLE